MVVGDREWGRGAQQQRKGKRRAANCPQVTPAEIGAPDHFLERNHATPTEPEQRVSNVDPEERAGADACDDGEQSEAGTGRAQGRQSFAGSRSMK